MKFETRFEWAIAADTPDAVGQRVTTWTGGQFLWGSIGPVTAGGEADIGGGPSAMLRATITLPARPAVVPGDRLTDTETGETWSVEAVSKTGRKEWATVCEVATL